MSPVILKMASSIRKVSLPHDFLIIDHLEKKCNCTLVPLSALSAFSLFNCGSSHQDEHKYRQDVEDSVTEQRPPAQGDRLERGEPSAHAHTHAGKSKANRLGGFGGEFPPFPPRHFTVCVYLPRKDATDSNDDQDIKDGRSHYSPHTHVPFSDKHP